MLLPLPIHDKYCWSWNRIYVKANGRCPCWCHAGESHTIIQSNDFKNADFVTDIVNSPQMRQMRLSILQENKPYIQQCHDCCCYQEHGKLRDKRYQDSDIANDITHQATQALQELKKVMQSHSWPLGSIDNIHEIQLEPSLPCNLRCPGCIHGAHESPLSLEQPPYLFPLEWFKHMIDCTITHNVKIKLIQYCGKGEPTLNKQLPDMIQYAYNKSISQSMDTNSNQVFNDAYLNLNRINCSIDGSTNESYSAYRRNGNFDKAILFMENAIKRKRELNSKCMIRWKYILFSVTEELKLLNKAQKIAKDIGIDELDFVITTCGAFDSSILPPQLMNRIDVVQHYINQNPIFSNTIVSRS